MSRKSLPLIGFAFAAGLTCGCSNDSSDQAPGTITMHLTDAAYPFDMIVAANLTLDGVAVRLKGHGFQSFGVPESLAVVNLLELRNGVTALLVESEIPAGEIDQIRLIVREAGVALSDGRTFDLDVPSGDSSGLKVFVDPVIEVVSGLTTDLLLDVDVSGSFKPVPASATRAEDVTHFQFHPVLRVANLSSTGTVSGHVHSDEGTVGETSDDVPLPGATVSAWRGGSQVAVTGTDLAGAFAFPGLEPGAVTIRAEDAGFTTAELPATVVIANHTRVAFRLSAAP